MKTISRRVLSCLLALTLLVTCGVSGLVLPAAADTYPEAGTNIATNGDFEDAAGTEWTNSSTYTVKSGVGFGGSAGLEMPAAKATLYYRTSLSLRPNSTYEITFLAKGTGMYFGSAGASKFTDVTIPGVANIANILSTTTSTEWIKYRVLFTTGDAPSVNKSYGFCFKRTSAAAEGSVTYVDNVEIRELTEEQAAAGIVGGDFEGYYSHQFTQFMADCTLETADDNTSLCIPAMAIEKYLKNVSLTANTKYTLSFKAKGGALGVFFYGEKLASDSPTQGWKTVPAGETWETYTYDFTTGASTDANFSLMFGKGNAAMTSAGTDAATYIDDVAITLAKAEPATGITLDKTVLSLGIGGSDTLTVAPVPANGTYDAVVWSSDTPAVATVDNGTVTAVSAGTATITATAGTLTATCTVTVMEAATAIELADEALHLAPATSKTAALVVTPTGADAGTLTWTSSDPAVATVVDGKITYTHLDEQ